MKCLVNVRSYTLCLAIFASSLAAQPTARSDDLVALFSETATSNSQSIDGALADAEFSVAIKPALAASYVTRGRAKYFKGDLAGAIADFDRATGIDATNAEAFYSRAVVKAVRKDLQGALLDYTQAIELRPALVQPYINRGAVEMVAQSGLALHDRSLAHAAMQKHSAAARDLKRAHRLNPMLVAPVDGSRKRAAPVEISQ